jgi:hypothetical protein
MPRMPEVKSFLVADTVLQEKGTNKWSVIGIFDQVVAAQFPTTRAGVGLYIKLADAEGRYKLRIEFRDSEDKCLTYLDGIEIATQGAVATLDLGVQTHNLQIPKAGRYHFMLYINGDLAQMVQVLAVQAKPAPPPPPAAEA